jgi:hypothetical protein
MSSKRGIYLVANLNSEDLCENLIFSIRKTGCQLPIRVIHFGGKPIQSNYILSNAEHILPESFPQQAIAFIDDLQSVLTECPRGFLNRFLALFGDWDEFIYSDNDIVALCNWEIFFDYLKDSDLVHADEEYITDGKFNYNKVNEVKQIFGEDAMLSAFTAGHFAAKRSDSFIDSIMDAIAWFKQNPSLPKKHDQALLHIASLLGGFKMKNLCREPHHWMSSWAGDYQGSFDLISKIQQKGFSPSISHLHYSGGQPTGTRPIEDLLYAKADKSTRLQQIVKAGLKELSGLSQVMHTQKKVTRRLKRIINNGSKK